MYSRMYVDTPLSSSRRLEMQMMLSKNWTEESLTAIRWAYRLVTCLDLLAECVGSPIQRCYPCSGPERAYQILTTDPSIHLLITIIKNHTTEPVDLGAHTVESDLPHLYPHDTTILILLADYAQDLVRQQITRDVAHIHVVLPSNSNVHACMLLHTQVKIKRKRRYVCKLIRKKVFLLYYSIYITKLWINKKKSNSWESKRVVYEMCFFLGWMCCCISEICQCYSFTIRVAWCCFWV